MTGVTNIWQVGMPGMVGLGLGLGGGNSSGGDTDSANDWPLLNTRSDSSDSVAEGKNCISFSFDGVIECVWFVDDGSSPELRGGDFSFGFDEDLYEFIVLTFWFHIAILVTSEARIAMLLV